MGDPHQGRSRYDPRTFMQGFVHANTSSGAIVSIVYTDEHSGYTGTGREHGTVCHSVGACTR